MKQTEVSMYHRLLRVSALTLAIALLFDSGIIAPVTKTLSQNTQLYVASVVQMTASVEPTDINTITTQLSARERELNAREAALNERALSVGLDAATSGAPSTYIMSLILFILLVLIVLNYVLDYLRTQPARRRAANSTMPIQSS